MDFETRIYGPEGFTRTPEVRAILDQYEDAGQAFGGMVRFRGVPVAEAARLLRLLPPAQQDDAQNFAPSFKELVTLLAEVPGATLHGYRITPERSDERITAEGFEMPVAGPGDPRIERMVERLRQRVVVGIGADLTGNVTLPDEMGLTSQGTFWAWWD